MTDELRRLAADLADYHGITADEALALLKDAVRDGAEPYVRVEVVVPFEADPMELSDEEYAEAEAEWERRDLEGRMG